MTTIFRALSAILSALVFGAGCSQPSTGVDGPRLAVDPEVLHLDRAVDSADLIITNTGDGTLTWTITANESWLDVVPASGTTTTEEDKITVSVDRRDLGPGEYSTSVTVASDGGDEEIAVSMAVVPNLALTMQPAESTISTGEKVTVSVDVEDALGLFVFCAELSFDRLVVEVPQASAQSGEFWDSGDYFFANHEAGRLSVCAGLKQTDDPDGIDGAGSLMSFEVEGLSAGTSDLTLENYSLLDEFGEPIPGFEGVVLTHGRVIVE